MIDNQGAKERREGVGSRTLVLRRDGSEIPLSESAYESEQDPDLKALIKRELGVKDESQMSPPHVDIMRQHELVGYEKSADMGHFRFYPKGALMKNLIEDLAKNSAAKQLGTVVIETPLLYRAEMPDIAEQAASFHERDYVINLDERELLLRFAGDFGLFSMMKDAQLSYRHLPLRVFEKSNSFRREKSGELAGLKRLRGFTMPDIHCFCKDLESGLEEFANIHNFCDQTMKDLGLPFTLAFRTVADLWGSRKSFVLDKLKYSRKDAIVEVLDEMKHYWNVKNEFQYIDTTGDNVQLSTVQLDISDSARYGLTYIDSDGQRKPMTIIHSSIGSVERILGAIFEERAKEMKMGKKPCFPFWLSPTQLRLIPVNATYEAECENLAERLGGVRVDIDDNNGSIGKKVRAAEKEWVPAYIVVGEREKSSGTYHLMVRANSIGVGESLDLKADRLAEVLRVAQADKPYRNSYFDRRVSRQIRFGSSY